MRNRKSTEQTNRATKHPLPEKKSKPNEQPNIPTIKRICQTASRPTVWPSYQPTSWSIITSKRSKRSYHLSNKHSTNINNKQPTSWPANRPNHRLTTNLTFCKPKWKQKIEKELLNYVVSKLTSRSHLYRTTVDAFVNTPRWTICNYLYRIQCVAHKISNKNSCCRIGNHCKITISSAVNIFVYDKIAVLCFNRKNWQSRQKNCDASIISIYGNVPVSTTRI